MATEMKSETGRKARPLFSFCAFHFIDDGFTDSLYLLLPFIAAELGLNFSQVGLLKGVFSVSMSLFQIPLSFLGERIGELTVIAAGTFGLAGGFLVLGRVHTFLAILISLIFAKATGGGQHGLSSSLLSRVFETSGRRAAMGTYNFSGDMGKVCLPFSLAVMVNLWGWRQAVSVLSIFGLAAGAILWMVAREKKSRSLSSPSGGGSTSKKEGLGNSRPEELFVSFDDRNHRYYNADRVAYLTSFSPSGKGDSDEPGGLRPHPSFCGRGFREVRLRVTRRVVRDHPDGDRDGSIDSSRDSGSDLVLCFADLGASSLGGVFPERNLVGPLRDRG